MVVGFTTTYAISAYQCELKSRSGRGVQHYVIKFVSDLRQVGDFSKCDNLSVTYDRSVISLNVIKFVSDL